MDRQHFRDPSLSARTMIQASVTIVAQEQQCDTLLGALRAQISVVRAETGCLGCWLYQDVEELDALTLVEEWDSAADLRCRLRSDDYRVLLHLMESSRVPPRVSFRAVEMARGLDLVQEARVPMQPASDGRIPEKS
jgi:quinol monooxygenase YgiN